MFAVGGRALFLVACCRLLLRFAHDCNCVLRICCCTMLFAVVCDSVVAVRCVLLFVVVCCGECLFVCLLRFVILCGLLLLRDWLAGFRLIRIGRCCVRFVCCYWMLFVDVCDLVVADSC